MPIHRHESSPDDDFSTLITREQDFLRALSRTMGVPPSDVADVLQEANLYMVEHQAKFIPGTNFRAWAAQVLRYRILQYFRRNKQRNFNHLSEDALEAVAIDAADQFHMVEPRLQRLQFCLKRLNPDQIQLLTEVYAGRKNLKQIAIEAGHSHVALRKTISRIRLLLKQCIENHREG